MRQHSRAGRPASPSFTAALGFLTPLGGARTPTPRALPWFPVVGALIGLGVGGAWWSASTIFPSAVAAAIAVVVGLGLTGMLHIDGLADSADGLLPHLSRERRLEVMSQPDIGAFGVAAVGGALLLQYAALASIEPDVVLVVAVCAASRALVAMHLALGRYAKSGGLATAFLGGSAWSVVVPGAIAVVAAPVPVACGLVAGVGVLVFANRRIGGFTGDVLGAALVVTETVALVAATAR